MTEGETVFDASALLAYFQDEPGADSVAAALERLAYVSAVNWAEVLSKVSEAHRSPTDFVLKLYEQGILGTLLQVIPLDESMAEKIGILRPQTRAQGLSLGDRACLALGSTLGLPVLTTDRRWRELSIDQPEIRVIR